MLMLCYVKCQNNGLTTLSVSLSVSICQSLLFYASQSLYVCLSVSVSLSLSLVSFYNSSYSADDTLPTLGRGICHVLEFIRDMTRFRWEIIVIFFNYLLL